MGIRREITSTSQGNTEQDTIIKKAEDLQKKIFGELPGDYSKAFDPNFNPGFFDSTKRFRTFKKPIAKNLLGLSSAKLTTIQQVVYFTLKYDNFIRQNEACDREGILKNGELSGVLRKYKQGFEELNSSTSKMISQWKKESDLYLEVLYHHGLAMFEEGKDAISYGIYEQHSSTRTNYKTTESATQGLDFHIYWLNKIKDDATTPDDLKDKVDELLEKSTELCKESLNKNIKIIKEEILKFRKQRMEADIAELIRERGSEFIHLAFKEKVLYILMREIMRNFADALTAFERQFLWHWHVRAQFSGLNCAVDNKNGYGITAGYMPRVGINMIDETKKYYMRGSADGSNNNYFQVVDLFDNKRLSDMLQLLADGVENINKDLIPIILSDVVSHLGSLEELKALEENKGWAVFWRFDDNNWAAALNELVKQHLLEPFEKLKQLRESVTTAFDVSRASKSTEEETPFSQLSGKKINTIYKDLSEKDLSTLYQTSRFFYSNSFIKAEMKKKVDKNIEGFFSKDPELFELFKLAKDICEGVENIKKLEIMPMKPMEEEKDSAYQRSM